VKTFSFLPARRYLARVLAVVLCLSVRLFVTSRRSTEQAKRIRSRKQRHMIAQGL